MKQGDVLIEKHTNLKCTVEKVYPEHMLVRFESGLSDLVRKAQYKNYRKDDE